MSCSIRVFYSEDDYHTLVESAGAVNNNPIQEYTRPGLPGRSYSTFLCLSLIVYTARSQRCTRELIEQIQVWVKLVNSKKDKSSPLA